MDPFPKPPKELLECPEQSFAHAPELAEWARATFIEDDGSLCNPEHEHLQLADVMFVWAALAVRKQGRMVVGTAQGGAQSGPPAKRQVLEWLYRTWNGGALPDFIVTICAGYVHESSERAVCALVEHELYHCGQASDEWGQPKYHKDGMPVFAMRGHDVEEFVGVVRRYGAYDESLQALAHAAKSGPILKRSEIVGACCGCGAVVAHGA